MGYFGYTLLHTSALSSQIKFHSPPLDSLKKSFPTPGNIQGSDMAEVYLYHLENWKNYLVQILESVYEKLLLIGRRPKLKFFTQNFTRNKYYSQVENLNPLLIN